MMIVRAMERSRVNVRGQRQAAGAEPGRDAGRTGVETPRSQGRRQIRGQQEIRVVRGSGHASPAGLYARNVSARDACPPASWPAAADARHSRAYSRPSPTLIPTFPRPQSRRQQSAISAAASRTPSAETPFDAGAVHFAPGDSPGANYADALRHGPSDAARRGGRCERRAQWLVLVSPDGSSCRVNLR